MEAAGEANDGVEWWVQTARCIYAA
jgi:hypothetical protein